ncbi:MAG: radical SAM protein [Halarcobacter sp.]
MSKILKWAQELYTAEHQKKIKYPVTKERTITKRGVVWLGQTCNIECYFCFYKDKIEDKTHPEHPFMSLEKAKKIFHTLRYTYGNTAIDIQGGEPTIYPHIFELIEYCNEIGLKPTLITNSIVLANKAQAQKFKDAGVNDFVVSTHAIGDEYDRIVGHKGGSKKQMQALKNLQELEIPFRMNCTMTKEVISQLPQIAKMAIDVGAKVVNFITFLPFADQQGNRDLKDVPNYTAISENISDAIDTLEDAGIECNVRYFPFCMLKEKHRKNIYNYQQLSYDHHEWDYNSWTWTTRFNQRSNSDTLDEPIPILMYGIDEYNDIDFSIMSKHGTKEHYMKNIDLKEHLLKLFNADIPKELLYKQNGKLRAQKHCEYKFAKVCEQCSVKDICDGMHNDYRDVFGEDELKPIVLDEEITDPTYYIKHQEKIID